MLLLSGKRWRKCAIWAVGHEDSQDINCRMPMLLSSGKRWRKCAIWALDHEDSQDGSHEMLFQFVFFNGGSTCIWQAFFEWGAALRHKIWFIHFLLTWVEFLSREAIIQCKSVPRDVSVGKSSKLIFAQFVCCTLTVLDMSDQALVTRFQLYKLSAQQWGEFRSSQGTHSQISCRIATVTTQASAWQLGDNPGVKIFRSFEN